ncbi:hypothetical protein Gogos_016972 [Gossypium gossypioides]|uniref:RNase H type-1 domain-containing protein n=1 Tax=Gossypium gossypioides TaxID=34282 RepID=A0A7J9B9E6_GOSGO|nr:hypothetical protein [Gossypium gossypioides]
MGQTLVACSRLTSWVPSAFAAEAQAVIHGLRFALDLDFQSVILEGGSRSVIQKIVDNGKDLSEISALTWEAKELAKSFRFCRFHFVDRSGNKAAHAMTRDGLRRDEDRFWVEEVPDLATVTVDDDCRSVEPP